MSPRNLSPAGRSGAGRNTRAGTRNLIIFLGLLFGGAIALVIAAPHLWPLPIDEPEEPVVELPSAKPPPVDPRLSPETPYRNVQSHVGYVGNARCAACHAEIARDYGEHPMSRSLEPIAEAATVEKFGAAHGLPLSHQGFEYLAVRHGEGLRHVESRQVDGETVARAEIAVDYAVGSGNHARAYLFERDGGLFQSPLTWFQRSERWGLSPAFAPQNFHFDLGVQHECAFCHGDQVRRRPQDFNRFEIVGSGVSCERCHGPGQLHVERRERLAALQAPGENGNQRPRLLTDEELRLAAGGIDETIVNPAHLSLTLRNAVCEQCHLEGAIRVPRRGREPFDYRPGLPLHLFFSAYVPTQRPTAEQEQDGDGFVGHADEMQRSGCYLGTNGRLGCVSCHDPHRRPAPAERLEFFRGRCLKCHETQSCELPVDERLTLSPGDDCRQCHMPKRPNHQLEHLAATDHRIVRTPGSPPRGGQAVAGAAPNAAPNAATLSNFHAAVTSASDPDAGRDLGIALIEYASRHPGPSATAAVQQALPLLQEAALADPADVPAWEALGRGLWGSGQHPAAEAVFRRAMQQEPVPETLLAHAATLAMSQGLPGRAAELLERLIERNPSISRYRLALADARRTAGQWEAADAAYLQALQHSPTEPAAHHGLGEVARQQARTNEAIQHYRRALQLAPDYLPSRGALADVFFANESWRAAAEHYQRVLQQQPDNLQAQQRLIACHERLGERQRADQLRRQFQLQ